MRSWAKIPRILNPGLETYLELGYAALVGGSPPLGRALRNPRHFVPPSHCAGGIEPVAPDELESRRWNVLRQLGQKVQGIEQVDCPEPTRCVRLKYSEYLV
jgi:hypothetical protein